MNRTCNNEWTAQVKGYMHKYRITNGMLSEKTGYSVAYLSEVLNSNRPARRYTKCAICNALLCIAYGIDDTISDDCETEELSSDETTDTG